METRCYRYSITTGSEPGDLAIYRFDDGPHGYLGPCVNITGELVADWSHLDEPFTDGAVISNEAEEG